ncbi:DNA repair protein RadA [Candidatus Nesciobacter abundans]|uniref:DNA repair protein RadA n=1 Tax=Candidatus Nesciobacter abundans TaxID=2601668 RepID=A0A5C0UIB4_9PROT|nr:DNA repair protein RadA [Candidatus Nesciobacter abundans]QEK39152.1 DNA repair protein RadA [Candidatus Nesciobacter abundans]
MSKTPKFTCASCGTNYSKWQGKCDSCNTWNSVMENIVRKSSIKPLELKVLSDEADEVIRFKTNISEFDHVCGGGLVAGSVTLVGGDPGIGKSTMLLQISGSFPGKVVYVSGEESLNQIKVRADRLNINLENMECAYGTNVDQIIETLNDAKPSLAMIDSVQTLYDPFSDTTPGSIAQVRICGNKLIQWAKDKNIPILIVSHVNKDGMIAGPKVLEHMVDTVLYFEGNNSMRIIRAIKNRFGSTNSMGIFEMRDKGLIPIVDASKSFLKNRSLTYGSCIFPAVEGNRPLLVEVQALVSNSYLQNPRRAVVGWDVQRLAMICAVLENHCKVPLSGKDIYLNIVGGIKVFEPSSDLSVAIVLMSAWYMIPVPQDHFVFGEIGLSGEIRPVSQVDQRLGEGEKLGFKSACIPDKSEVTSSKMDLIQFKHVQEVQQWLRSKAKD